MHQRSRVKKNNYLFLKKGGDKVELDNIIKKLKDIYSNALKTDISEDVFKEGVELVEVLHIDSLVGLQIVVKIEQEFDVMIDDDDFAISMINSLTKAVKFIQEKQTMVI